MKPKMYAAFTENQRELYTKCLAPSAAEFELITAELTGECGKWGTTGFSDASTQKAQHILAGLRSNPGEVILWADADIIIFARVYDDILALLGDKQFAASPGGFGNHAGDINTGFMAIRSTPLTIQMFEYVVAAPKSPKVYDQYHTNAFLLNYAVPKVYLPPQYFHKGLMTRMTAKMFMRYLPVDIKIFHATYVGGETKKLQALLQVKQIIEARTCC